MEQFKTLREIRDTLGLSRRIIQGYEKYGLIRFSSRNKYGHLLYDDKTIKRMTYIRFYQKLGFELKEIAEFIDKPAKEIKEVLYTKSSEIKNQIEILLDEYNSICSYLDSEDDDRFEKDVLKIINQEDSKK